jgi:4-alpha-glucanotransferase
MKVKTTLLHRIYEMEKKSTTASESFRSFVANNKKEWLASYAVFCHFRDENNTSDYTKWKTMSIVTAEQIEALSGPSSPFYDEIQYTYFVQYQLHKQLLDASTYP